MQKMHLTKFNIYYDRKKKTQQNRCRRDISQMTNNKYTANITLNGEEEKLFLSDHEQGRIPNLPTFINIVLEFPATAIS